MIYRRFATVPVLISSISNEYVPTADMRLSADIRGVVISEAFHDVDGVYAGPDQPYLFWRLRGMVQTRSIAATAHSPR
jgi:hypothetical protein